MIRSDNPYNPPGSVVGTLEPASLSSFPRGFLSLQVAVAVFCVVVGLSESNDTLHWAQALVPLVYLFAPFLLVSPLILLGLCTVRRIDCRRFTIAFVASVGLSFVGFLGTLPLVQ
ncbi:hypothetical protein [Planctomycetes bacterium K23_9]|uniref:Uncharacterized protein n=1 Tax=Stieleria marina TaxID=1930275 RepID=A0A517NSY4_9BACT|nr:hypothetical protein K239x_21960 [Planctomycetes bacterium K23_9]